MSRVFTTEPSNQNFNETIKQWTGVFGYSLTPEQTLQGVPSSQYTKYIYGPSVVGVYGTGVGHTVPVMGNEDLAWFGITGGSSSSSTTTKPTSTVAGSSTSTTLVTSTTSASSGGGSGTSPHWGQCGGIGWTGPTVVSGFYSYRDFANVGSIV